MAKLVQEKSGEVRDERGRVFVEKSKYLQALKDAKNYKGSYKTNFRKWGNSVAVRIPKALLVKAGAKENKEALVFVDGKNIVISKS